MNTESYIEHINALRQKEDKDTAADPLHWLNLAGLFWLEEGDNSFGSSESNKIVLAMLPHSHCGNFHYENGLVTLVTAKDAQLTINDKSPKPRPLRSDYDKTPDHVQIGSLVLTVIKRGENLLIRVWDKESPAGKNFKGFKYYPAKPEYRITARYVPYHPPKTRMSVDVIGTETENTILGQAQFTLNGVNYTLEAEKSGNKLLFNFTDKTKEDTTYGGGRKFTAALPEGEEIILDFNLADNWPCAYTPFATCPIPPIENRLSVRIEAGEKRYFE